MIKNSKQPTRAVFAFVAAALLVSLPLGKALQFAYFPYHAGTQSSTIIEVQKGISPNDLTKKLVSHGVISSGKDFIWLGRLTRQWGRVKAGEYQVSPGMSPMQIFSTLTSGISVIYPITVREGENLYEIAESLADKKLINSPEEFTRLCFDQEFIASFPRFKDAPPKSLEGFLFPDTYNFNHSLTKYDIARQMVRHFFDYWKAEHDTRSATLGMTPSQIITLASMIERETGAPEERPLISSVFYNRIRKKMRLQSDPTTIYGIWKRYRGNLLKADLMEKNEYNTYQVPGLPVGPISNPGALAIQAALYPTQSSFLYFVSHNDGTHEFTSTYEAHLAAVRKFQLDPKAREGKSWRDLAKKTNPKKE